VSIFENIGLMALLPGFELCGGFVQLGNLGGFEVLPFSLIPIVCKPIGRFGIQCRK
jgi:hypothetical protein